MKIYGLSLHDKKYNLMSEVGMGLQDIEDKLNKKYKNRINIIDKKYYFKSILNCFKLKKFIIFELEYEIKDNKE